jgi:hypothetical protein
MSASASILHFSLFQHSATSRLVFCAFFGKVSIASTNIVAECRKQRFSLWQPFFYFHYRSTRLHPVSLSVTISQGVAYRFKWLCCKRRQTAVCSPTLHYLRAFNYAFSNPAALQKAGCRNQAGVYNKTLHPTANSGVFFETLSSA